MKSKYAGSVILGATAARVLTTAFVTVIAWPTIAADPAQDIYAKYADSVVTISTYDECLFPKEQGSGVIIKTEKANIETGSFILTNYHVIFRPGRIVVSTKGGHNVEATICYFDEASDTALLHIREYIVCTIPSPARTTEVGSPVFAIGTPRGLGWTISNGIVSSLRTANRVELVQFTAPVSNGSSGGPLFDAKGELIGITSFKLRESENLNFALRIKPETMRQLEQRCWAGAQPLGIEDGWCVGHFEESENWRGENDKAKSWDAHSSLIAGLQKKLFAASKKEGRAATEELIDAARFGARPAHPLNVLKSRIDQAYASRFEDFPEDWEGWLGATNTETDPRAIDRLMQVGLEKWPHCRDVYFQIFYYLYPNKPESCMKFIESTVDALPSKDDVTALPSDESYALQDARHNLEELISDIHTFCDSVTGAFENKFAERIAGVRRTLNAKGWQEISNKSRGKDTQSRDSKLIDLSERAEQGDPVSQFNLGFAYQTGDEVPKNPTKAADWYRKAADQGNLGAQFMLGFMYRTGEGVKIDYAEALRWYQKAAEAGDGASQSELGAMYENGLGVPVDYRQAAHWYTKAVDRGWGYSNLGSLYQHGRGVMQDDRKAVELYLRGAETGDANAQVNLGVMYATGRGVSRDHAEAYKWFTIALKSKGENANVNRDLLVKRMTADQIAEGERRAAAFVPKENPARHKLPSR